MFASPEREAAEGGSIRDRCNDSLSVAPEILNMEPEQFVSEILKQKLHASYVVVGTDWRFGHERKGDVTFLQSLQKI